MKKYTLAIAFLVGAVILQVIPVFASYVTTGGSITIPGSNGELLFNNNGNLGAVPNAFATSSATSPLNVNVGAYANYPNPSGMLNTYDESLVNPILSASFMGSTTQYVQIFGQNLNPAGSMDMVFADDKGNATSTKDYVDFGIANSTQNDSDHTLILPYDSYFYSQSGRVLIGSATTTASSSVIISEGMQSTSPNTTFDQYGHIITHGATPTSLSGCGTSPSVSGNDTNGVITLGSGLSITACTMAFKNPYPTGSAVSCSVTTNSTLGGASVTSVSTTGFTVGLSVALGGGKVYYQCQASQ